MVLNGAIGAKLHVPFSVITTGSFGYYFRYFCIVSRAILAMFWFGIQGANGMFFSILYFQYEPCEDMLILLLLSRSAMYHCHASCLGP